MQRVPVRGPVDLWRGREDYEALGPLTDSDLAKLSAAPPYRVKNLLHTWYGWHGAAYAKMILNAKRVNV